VNASAEGPRGPSKVRQTCADSRGWLRARFTELAAEAGARDPAALGRRLGLLYDGAVVGAPLDADPARVATDAWAMANDLLDAYAAKAVKATNGGKNRRTGR
jgi:hypothetical protein